MPEPRTNSFRDDAIYVQWQTRAGLNYVSKAMPEMTTDELANTILAEWLKEKHPDVVEHMKNRHEADDLFRKGLEQKLKSRKPCA